MYSLRLDTIQHRLRRLPRTHRVSPQRVSQRRAYTPRTGQDSTGTRERAVLVSGNEQALRVRVQVSKRLGELGVVDVRVESAEDYGDVWVWGKVLQIEGLECGVRWILGRGQPRVLA